MFDDIPDNYKSADRRQRRRGLALHAGRQERAAAAGAADARPRRALHHARSARGPRQPARRRVPRHRLDQGAASRMRAEHIKKKLPSMYHQFKELADIDITEEPMEVGPTTHYIMGGIRVDGDTQMSTRARAVRGGRVRGGPARREPAGRQLAVGPAGVRQAGRRVRGEVRARERARGTIDEAEVDAASQAALAPFERGAGPAEGPVQDPVRAAGHDAGLRRHRAQRERDGEARSRAIERAARAGEQGRRRRQPRVQPGLAHGARPREHAHLSPRRSRARRIERKESRGGHFREDYPGQGSGSSAKFNLVVPQGAPTARCRSCARADLPEMRDGSQADQSRRTK